MVSKVVGLLVLLTLAALACGQAAQGGPHQSQGGPHESQGGPHENQGRARRQASQIPQDNQSEPPQWTSCDFTVDPKISCADCNTRLICKPVGGLLKPCDNPLRPHCNAGICSSVPSAGCQ